MGLEESDEPCAEKSGAAWRCRSITGVIKLIQNGNPS